MEWTDEQLKIILNSAYVADDGCSHCISLVLAEFIRQTDFSLLERMEKFHDESKCGHMTWENLDDRVKSEIIF